MHSTNSILIVIIIIEFFHSASASASFPLLNSSASFSFKFKYRYLIDYSGHYELIAVEGKILKIFKDGRPWDNSSYSSLRLPLSFARYSSFMFAPVTLNDSGIYRFDVQIRPLSSFDKYGISRLSLYGYLEIRGLIGKKLIFSYSIFV